MLNIGMENIDFQLNHKFPKEHDEFVKKIQHLRYEIIDQPEEKIQPTEWQNIIKRYKTIFSNKFSSELKSLLKKHFGINVSRLYQAHTFACGWEGSDADKFFKLMLTVVDNKIKLNPTDIDFFKKFVEEYEKYLDLKKVKVSVPKDKLDMVLYYDTYFIAFTDIYSYGNCQLPDPKYITAILLHEIGHYFTILEMCLPLVYFGYLSNNVVYTMQYFKDKGILNFYQHNKDIIIDFIKKVYDQFKKSTNITKGIPPIEYAINFIYNSLQKLHLLNNKPFMQIWAALRFLSLLIYFVIFPVIFLVIFINSMLMLMEKGLFDILQPHKYEPTSGKSLSYPEILADEFVTKFGYSEYLIKGLDLYWTYGQYFTTSDLGSYMCYNTGMLASILRLCNKIRDNLLFWMVPPQSFLVDVDYEKIEKRFYRAIQLSRTLAKKKELDPSTRELLLRNTYQLEQELSNFRNYKLARSIRLFWSYIMGAKYPSSILDIVNYPNKIRREIIEKTDELMSNKLYVQYQRLQDLIEK